VLQGHASLSGFVFTSSEALSLYNDLNEKLKSIF
jgi:hypothetical protein